MFVPPQLPIQQLLNHAGQLQRSGNLSGAASVYRQVLRQQPRNAQVLGRLGQVLIGLGQVDEAKRTLDQAMKIAPKSPLLHHDMHLLHRRRGDLAKAHDSIDKALKLSPRQPVFTAAKAELFTAVGEFDRAMKTIEPVLATAPQFAPVAMMLAALSPRYGREPEAIAALRSIMSNEEVGPIVRMRAGFALTHVLDWSGDYAGAAAAAVSANRLAGGDWDVEEHRKKVDRTIETWTRDATAALPKSTADASDLVLVVGMPRCGNVLVTRILTAIDDTISVGERNNVLLAARDLEGSGTLRGAPMLFNFVTCTENALTEKATAYLEEMRTAHPQAKRLIDRNSMNMLGLGLASRMLPNVRVIHCKRDSGDSAVSCWFAPFNQGYPFMYDSEALGAFQRDVERLMSHWREALDTPIHEVAYEDLLARPEATAREIVEFVGGQWSDRALEPARTWVSTITQPDGTMRDIVPDGRPGLAKDYEELIPDLFAALRG